MRQKIRTEMFPSVWKGNRNKTFFKLRKKAIIKLYIIHSSTLNVIYEKSPVSQLFGETQKETQ